jgi:eukaryotic-like serine/threonine-protein kinase
LPSRRIPDPGYEVGRYRLLRLVGEGARGAVFEADDPAFDRSVAIKILKPELQSQADIVQAFKDEAESTARVQNENVVSILASGEHDGLLYYVMEYVDGPDLDIRLRGEKRLPWKEAVSIAVQVGRGLKEAHALGLLHRDVKPDNILVYANGSARLTDFGIVKDISSLRGFLVHGRSVGTAAYASPEQCLGKRLMPCTDVYSLGATLYRIVTGRFPFPGHTNKEFMAGHVKGKLTPPIDVLPEIPRPLSNAILKMMARSPLDRYETIDEAIAVLEMIGQGKKPLGGGSGSRNTGAVRIESRRAGGTATGRVAARRGGTSMGIWIFVGVLVAVAVTAFVLLSS